MNQGKWVVSRIWNSQEKGFSFRASIKELNSADTVTLAQYDPFRHLTSRAIINFYCIKPLICGNFFLQQPQKTITETLLRRLVNTWIREREIKDNSKAVCLKYSCSMSNIFFLSSTLLKSISPYPLFSFRIFSSFFLPTCMWFHKGYHSYIIHALSLQECLCYSISPNCALYLVL